MKDLKVGMYVRTIKGKIWVIISSKAIDGHRKDILKASHNIIDLIEVGDYVNGCKVGYIDDCTGVMRQYYYDYENPNKDVGHWFEEIKSIVTKEQFEAVTYKIGE